ncbi:MAG: hypothetical protein PF513_02890 [Tenericutes bacterium]|nr:hypothetical protein [Mycoplasmatota bacterium]
MKNKGTDQKEGVEFNRVDSGKSPGDQPLHQDKEVVTKKVIRTRFLFTLLLLLAVIVFIILVSLV